MVPPGVKFLFFILLRLGTFIAVVSFLPLSIWVRVGIVVLCVPSSFVLRIVYEEFRWKRDAAAAGARLPPRAVGNRIGNIDILKKMLNVRDSGYLGAQRSYPQTNHYDDCRRLPDRPHACVGLTVGYACCVGEYVHNHVASAHPDYVGHRFCEFPKRCGLCVIVKTFQYLMRLQERGFKSL